MTSLHSKIVPHLWFDTQAVEAAKFYVSVFKDARILNTTTLENTPSGSVDTVRFELLGQEFMAISAGPMFRFNEAISFMVKCDTQAEIDYYWQALTQGGEEVECGWLRDKFGLSWQIVPTIMDEMMQSTDPQKIARITQAFLQMKKFDIATLETAFNAPQKS